MMPDMSMNRAALSALICSVSLIGNAAAQTPAGEPAKSPQATKVSALVAAMAEAEAALTSLRMSMTTTGKLPGGLDVVTQGELRVLRKTQAKTAPQLFSQVLYSFGDGMRGRFATSQTEAGITIYEEDPAFGAVFLEIQPPEVADLEWASSVLKKSDLPGMTDSRAQSPLGSGMLRDLSRIFDLAVADDTKLGGEQGTWVRGGRKAGLDAQDPDLPLADSVELFVRGSDKALLLARFSVGEDVVQELKVNKLEVGVKFEAKDFTVDGHGERIRNVKEYTPMWAQINEAIGDAERKSKLVRPSERTKDDENKDKPKAGGPEESGQKEGGNKKEGGR